jgi:uncharacterized protein HemY
MMPALGKMLVILGAVIILAGVILIFANKIPFIGRLPGDILVKRESFTFCFPITTCIIISIVLTLIFWILRK